MLIHWEISERMLVLVISQQRSLSSIEKAALAAYGIPGKDKL
jgi:hypothetical protein